MHFDEETLLTSSVFIDCNYSSLETSQNDISLFITTETEALLTSLGATIQKSRLASPVPAAAVSVSQEAIKIVDRFVKASLNTWDVAVEDIEDRVGRIARDIAKIGVNTRVMKDITRATSGPKKTFVRFQVDRDTLRRGHIRRTGVVAIDSFWTELANEYPAD